VWWKKGRGFRGLEVTKVLGELRKKSGTCGQTARNAKVKKMARTRRHKGGWGEKKTQGTNYEGKKKWFSNVEDLHR